MPPLAWKPEYSVGDPAVDHEHRELIDRVNAAAGAIVEGRPTEDVDRHMGELFRAISAHFAHEEKQMNRAGYDQYPLHKKDHERLLDALRDIMDGADADAGQTAEKLTAALDAWFIDHFRIHDARLHKRLGSHEH